MVYTEKIWEPGLPGPGRGEEFVRDDTSQRQEYSSGYLPHNYNLVHARQFSDVLILDIKILLFDSTADLTPRARFSS